MLHLELLSNQEHQRTCGDVFSLYMYILAIFAMDIVFAMLYTEIKAYTLF